MAFAFATAALRVLCSWLAVCSKAPHLPTEMPKSGNRSLFIFRSIYCFLVFVNALILIVGTIFHLVGVFRTCWCERLTWADSTLIELNSKTQQAYDNARRYWLSTAYVAFGVVWLVCLTAIGFRSYIVHKIEEWIDFKDKALGVA